MVKSRSWLLTALLFAACGGDEDVTFAGDDGGAGTGSLAGSGGAGGNAGTAGDGGTGGTERDAGPDAVEPAETGTSDAADAGNPDGDGGTGASDAGADATDGDPIEASTDGCARPTVYYEDKDRDRYGSSARFVSACAPPPGNWALTATDCKDDDSRVHPNQAAYFAKPYRTANGASSFDYDCSGIEEEDPAQDKAPQNCGLLSIALCGGTGYTPTERVGPGLSAYCGSEEVNVCRAALAILICESVTEPAEEPFRCK